MATLFKVKALYEFQAGQEDDLGFAGGQVIDVTEEVDENWLEGKYTDSSGAVQSGIFPREFVEKYEPALPARPTRPARPKQEAAATAITQPPPPAAEAEEPIEKDEVPPLPALSKPQAPPADVPSPREEKVSSPPPSAAQSTQVMRDEPPPAPRPTPAEPAQPAAKKAPPPVAAKSNAFRDRIAAFNQPAAAPVMPMQPGGPKPTGGFIKKPFVAPPPSSSAYVPPPKVEPIHKPYVREEDPEIRRRQEEDRAAAEAAGLTNEPQAEQAEEGEDAPKPQSLKERIALLQKQQMEQAQRRAGDSTKKEKKAVPTRQGTESSEQAAAVPEGEEDELEPVISGGRPERQSMDVPREKPRVSSTQRRPVEPRSPPPAALEHEILSGNEADQSAAGETTEDESGTIGPDSDDGHAAAVALPRAPTAPSTLR